MKFLLPIFCCLAFLCTLYSCSKSDDPNADFPVLNLYDSVGTEGSNVVFRVTLTKPSTDTVSFTFSTSDGTATKGDYYKTTVDLPFFIFPGQVVSYVTIPVSSDTLTEGDETFKVTVTSVKKANIGDGEATGTIKNGAVAPSYFLTAKINGNPWTAVVGGFFGAEFLFANLGAYGTGADFDSQLAFNFYDDPSGVATYQIEEESASDNEHVAVYWSPNFFSGGLGGQAWLGQPGGSFVISKWTVKGDVTVAEGTFALSLKASDASVVVITEGKFKLPVTQ